MFRTSCAIQNLYQKWHWRNTVYLLVFKKLRPKLRTIKSVWDKIFPGNGLAFLKVFWVEIQIETRSHWQFFGIWQNLWRLLLGSLHFNASPFRDKWYYSLLLDSETLDKLRFGIPLSERQIICGSMVQYHPISAKYQSRLHLVSKKVCPRHLRSISVVCEEGVDTKVFCVCNSFMTRKRGNIKPRTHKEMCHSLLRIDTDQSRQYDEWIQG